MLIHKHGHVYVVIPTDDSQLRYIKSNIVVQCMSYRIVVSVPVIRIFKVPVIHEL